MDGVRRPGAAYDLVVGDLGERLVDALNATYGVHKGHRAAHAKGVLCAASFTATSDASALSRAPHLDGATHRAHVRFSNGSGDPTVHDGQRDGRGMALKVYLPDGATTDVVTLSLPLFFVRTPEDLIEFNEARRPDPETGGPDLARVGEFLGRHPETVPAVMLAMEALPPASFAQVAYHSIHAFGFVSADGSVRYGRYHFVPEAGEASIDDADAMARPDAYLVAELEERLAAAPVRFRVEIELAGAGDPVDDPTAAWPDDRERVHLADLEVSALAFDREVDGDVLVFDPTRVPDGIELTDDPILRARSAAYRASVARRTAT